MVDTETAADDFMRNDVLVKLENTFPNPINYLFQLTKLVMPYLQECQNVFTETCFNPFPFGPAGREITCTDNNIKCNFVDEN